MQNILKTTILASSIATLATLSACSSDPKPQPITIVNPTAPAAATPPSTTTVITQPPAGSSMPGSSTTYYNTPRSY